MTEKVSKTEQYIKAAVEKSFAELQATAGNTITNSSFIGVQFDAKAVDTISAIANGLTQNAQAFGKLAEVLKASNVQIDAMVELSDTQIGSKT